MIKTTAIKLINPEAMMVTWDIGRRCNYDCTYCPALRHNTYSDFHKFEEYKYTFDFIKQWTSIYNSHRKDYIGFTNINFTGGEPTINPDFWKLLPYIKSSSDDFRLNLTTNGTWGKEIREQILKYISAITISYHVEAKSQLKKRVIDNIIHINDQDMYSQVNLMLHSDYWEECVQVYELLKSHGVNVKPRPIGDEPETKGKWFIDDDGIRRRTSHIYSQEQQEWFFSVMAETDNSCTYKSKSSDELGRACCGGRCLSGLVNNAWQDVNLIDTYFKDWLCTVDWYFLHIEQHTGLIYHHQTCQATHDKTRGPIGHLRDSKKLLQDLEIRIKNPQPIVCPNQICGCGLCAPKAEKMQVFDQLWKEIIKDDKDQEM